MSSPSAIMVNVAALMNDQDRAVYDDDTVLPYFNMALMELKETFELNNIPVTNETSSIINCPAGTEEIGFFVATTTQPTPDPDTPYLPSDLIDIRQVWESWENQDNWSPMTRKEFLPHYLQTGVLISQFLIWAWINQKIKVIPANTDIDIKLDYVRDIFSTIDDTNLGTDLGVVNIDSFMQYKTAALCSLYIGENPERAESLNMQAIDALQRSLGISVKSAQSITTRRRPFRSAFKMRNSYY